MTAPAAISTRRLEEHLRVLTGDIGIRLAGSSAEALAADYIAGTFCQTGAAVTLETFPVRERCVTEEHLEVFVQGAWKAFPCSLFSSTPGTDGATLEAPLVFFAAPVDYARGDLSFLRGKAVVHLGCHIESREAYRRLMAAEPAFLLFVDIRYPGATPLADGMFPSYTRDLGALPTLNVAYQDAWSWRRQEATAARIRVRAQARPATSQAVIADLPGTDPAAGVLVASAHHDTQAGSVGADDNASGVVTLLEMARVLAPLPRRQTLRLISFGAEEQLSVGSAAYVRRHRHDIASAVRAVLNLDSHGSLLGWTELNANGPDAMVEALVDAFRKVDVYPAVTREVVPYTDQFPFAVLGIPGIWLSRRNCTAGRFFHHLPSDDMAHLSSAILAAHGQAMVSVMQAWSATPTLPFPVAIPAAQTAAIATFWEDLYGGWAGLA